MAGSFSMVLLLSAMAWSITFAESRVIRGGSQVRPIVDGVKKVMEGVKHHADKVEDAIKPKKREKVQMDPIEIFRAEMCLHRDALIKHEKCLKWFVEVCKTETSGHGSCEALKNYLKNVCLSPTRKEGKAKAEACEFCKKLGVELPEDLEKEKAEEEVKPKAKEIPVKAVAPAPKPAESAPAPAPKAPKAAEAPAPAPAKAKTTVEPPPAEKPAPAPAKAKEAAAEKEPEKVKVSKVEVAPAPAPTSSKKEVPESWPKNVDYSKKERKLPDQGYDEHSTHEVEYDNMKNHAKDWQEEWPQNDESEAKSYKRICAEKPDNAWCKDNGHHQPPAAKKKVPSRVPEKSWWESIFR